MPVIIESYPLLNLGDCRFIAGFSEFAGAENVEQC